MFTQSRVLNLSNEWSKFDFFYIFLYIVFSQLVFNLRQGTHRKCNLTWSHFPTGGRSTVVRRSGPTKMSMGPQAARGFSSWEASCGGQFRWELPYTWLSPTSSSPSFHSSNHLLRRDEKPNFRQNRAAPSTKAAFLFHTRIKARRSLKKVNFAHC